MTFDEESIEGDEEVWFSNLIFFRINKRQGYFGFEDPEFWYTHGFHLSTERHVGHIKSVLKKMAKEHLLNPNESDFLYGMAL